ncbi:hypothetical protein B0H16DRAFT_1474806 [Mycena metata]|uniref:Uncharacterized protein n=1 Tax=Mycena metata TaxID=1033252 RepID=A0AAD7HG01_9AGAR|nr:hypothetical protein B0H16DRAFT_1474806 [Mycena metata]
MSSRRRTPRNATVYPSQDVHPWVSVSSAASGSPAGHGAVPMPVRVFAPASSASGRARKYDTVCALPASRSTLPLKMAAIYVEPAEIRIHPCEGTSEAKVALSQPYPPWANEIKMACEDSRSSIFSNLLFRRSIHQKVGCMICAREGGCERRGAPRAKAVMNDGVLGRDQEARRFPEVQCPGVTVKPGGMMEVDEKGDPKNQQPRESSISEKFKIHVFR